MDKTEQSTLQKLKDEVLRKIGSNLLLFQQIEGLLKLILGTSHAQGKASDLKVYQEQRLKKTQTNMMGLLIQQYIDEILSESDKDQQEPHDLSEPWISFSFKTIGNDAFYETQCQNLKIVLKERNKLVHHFLPYLQPDSLDQLINTSTYLDNQREKVLPVYEHLLSVNKSMSNTKQLCANILASAEWNQNCELMRLQMSPLINLFCEIATQIRRADGWACLAHAGKLAHTQVPNDVVNMKETYGYGTFKKMLIASQLFEIFDEPLPSGGSRTLYRSLQTKLHHFERK